MSVESLTLLMDNCLLPVHGYVWTAIPDLNITKASMKEQLADFDTGNSINQTDITKNLDVLAYTKSFAGVKTKLLEMSPNDSKYNYSITSSGGTYGVNPYQADEQIQYTADITATIAAIKSATIAVQTSIDATNTISTEFATALNGVINSTGNITNTLIGQIWEVGSCEILAASYKGIYDPVCSLGNVFAGAWLAAYTAGIFGIILMPFICVSHKRYYQWREKGHFDKQDDILRGEHKGAIAPMGGTSAAGAMTAAGATAMVDIPVASAIQGDSAVPVAQAVVVTGPGDAPPLYPNLEVGRK